LVLRVADDASCRIGVLLKMASISNLSQIRFANGEYEQAQEAVNQLSSLMRRRGTSQALFEEPQVQGMLMNALLLKKPTVAPAA
jgi:hypothetical protein